MWRDGRVNLYSIHLFLAIILLIFPPNTLFHRYRPIRPVRLTGFQQARQAFPLGLGLYRDCGSLVERMKHSVV